MRRAGYCVFDYCVRVLVDSLLLIIYRCKFIMNKIVCCECQGY
nr:MAG TPA: hypothetical protein [Caudoviricetes sp.]